MPQDPKDPRWCAWAGTEVNTPIKYEQKRCVCGRLCWPIDSNNTLVFPRHFKLEKSSA